MKTCTKILLATLMLACMLPLSAKVAVNYLPRTGDAALDANLVALDEVARSSQAEFIDSMVSELGSPRYLLRDYLEKKRWAPGDVYCACAIAYEMQRPCAQVLREYDARRAQGWSAYARELGLLPGSAGFAALKERVSKAQGRMMPLQAPDPAASQDVAADAAPPANKEGKR